jgi:hypothetical protein
MKPEYEIEEHEKPFLEGKPYAKLTRAGLSLYLTKLPLPNVGLGRLVQLRDYLEPFRGRHKSGNSRYSLRRHMNGSFYIQLASVSSRDSQDIASRRRFSSLLFMLQRGERGCQAIEFIPRCCSSLNSAICLTARAKQHWGRRPSILI